MRPMGTRGRIAFVALMIGLAAPAAHAQAVVETKGALEASLSHSYGFASSIVESEGQSYPNQYIHSQTTTLAVEYVPIEKLAVGLSVPLVGTAYFKGKSGKDYTPHGPYDDGSYHFTVQDLHADARYLVLPAPFALAFNVGLTVPLADYPVQGSAAPGRHLVQGRLGVAISYAPSFLPEAFVNASYDFTLSQKFDHSPDTAKFGQSKSDASAQVGYFVTSKLPIFLTSVLHVQHDGVDFVNYAMLTADQQAYHDPILHEAAFLLGLGASYQLTDNVFISGSYLQFLTGRNTIAANIASVTLGWNIL